MPELPEVETVVRDLRPQLSGRRIVDVELGRDPAALARVIRYPAPRAFGRRLRGQTIAAVERRGKYIVMPLGQNGGRFIVHLSMTGHPRAWESEEAPVNDPQFLARLDR